MSRKKNGESRGSRRNGANEYVGDYIQDSFMRAVCLAIATGYEPGIRCLRGLFLTCNQIFNETIVDPTTQTVMQLPPSLKLKLDVDHLSLRDVSRRYQGRSPAAMRYWEVLAAHAQLTILTNSTVSATKVFRRIHAMQSLTDLVLKMLVQRPEGDVVIHPSDIPFLERAIHYASERWQGSSDDPFCDPRSFGEEDPQSVTFLQAKQAYRAPSRHARTA